jgi:HK97 family phage major capsid protein
MSMHLFELKKERNAALEAADALLAVGERGNRGLTAAENESFDSKMAEVGRLGKQIEVIESRNTLRNHLTDGKLLPGNGNGAVITKPQPKTLSAEYVSDFFEHIVSGGRKVTSALYEGSNAAGGFAVPSIVDQTIVPLAPQEMAIRKLATVLPTSMDVKIPIKATKGTAAAKLEGDGTGSHLFGGTSPTLAQKTLSAFMAGDILNVSWESLQDITFFQAFATDDIITAVLEYEEPKFIHGTGSGEPEGVLTGCDTGVTLTGGHLVQAAITLDSIYDLVATLNGLYHTDAAFLMQRATGLFIRKLQRQANLFEPVWTREAGQDYLLGYPVAFSQSMPDGSTDQDKPIVFGSFKRGFVIGDRGGSGIAVKVLDQPKAVEGITQLLAYRRTDSKVRRSEALKALKLATGA